MGSKIKLLVGGILTIFNICVFIFTQGDIYPEYFEWLFAFYFSIGFIVGIKLIIEGISAEKGNKTK